MEMAVMSQTKNILFSVANLITLSRFALTIFLIISILNSSSSLQLLNPFLLMLIILMDGLDGYFARLFQQESLLGALLDIAVDRIIELSLWVVLAKIDLVPVWVAIVFLMRDVLVDTIRNTMAKKEKGPFEMMTTPIGRFLVAGRFMRFFYAAIKCFTFAWLLSIQALSTLSVDFWHQHTDMLQMISSIFIYSSVFICLLRGAPVIWEFILQEKEVYCEVK